jgi:DNA-binding NtrC family response regulator
MSDRWETRGFTAGSGITVPVTSAIMVALYAAAEKLADLDVPVLIVGEAGTGKRAIARHIHDVSSHRHEPFRIIDSSVYSEAVTSGNGADRLLGTDGMAFFTVASQVTEPAQQKILKLIKRGRGTPRIMVASNVDLDDAVRARHLGEEFCYVIGSVCLHVPPLRTRREEIPFLANCFLEEYSRSFGRPKPEPSAAALEFFRHYRWPGNVAELETAMKSLAAIGDESLVLAALHSSAWAAGRTQGPPTASLKQAARTASFEAERQLISDVLASTGWNRKRAAQQLQISYKALLYKLKRIGIESPALTKAAVAGDS